MRSAAAVQLAPADSDPLAALDDAFSPLRRIWLSERDGIWCLVDAVDFGWLSANTWNVSWGSRTPWQHYAKRNVGWDRATVRMHREIMTRADPRSDRFMRTHHVDHGNGQTLDNRRDNLTWVTNRQNSANRRPRAQIPSVASVALELLTALGVSVQSSGVPF